MIEGKYLLIGDDLSECFKIRNEVFVIEQGVSQDLEYDGLDEKAIHAIISENKKYVGTGRLLQIDDKKYKIGRIAVLKEERGKGYGDFLVRMLCDKGFLLGATEIVAGVQLKALPFYEKIGFIKYGEEFMDADIPHIMMKLDKCGLCKECDKGK